MARELLAIPEEHLLEVVRVIRAGLRAEDVSAETVEHLGSWCDGIEAYIARQASE